MKNNYKEKYHEGEKKFCINCVYYVDAFAGEWCAKINPIIETPIKRHINYNNCYENNKDYNCHYYDNENIKLGEDEMNKILDKLLSKVGYSV